MASINSLQKIYKQIDRVNQTMNRISTFNSSAAQAIKPYQHMPFSYELSPAYQAILQNQNLISQLFTAIEVVPSFDFLYQLQTTETIALNDCSVHVFQSAFDLTEDSDILSDNAKKSVRSDIEKKQLSAKNIEIWLAIFRFLFDVFFGVYEHIPNEQTKNATEYYQQRLETETRLIEIEEEKLTIEREKLELIKQILDSFQDLADDGQTIDPSMLEISYGVDQDTHSNLSTDITEHIQQYSDTEQ